MLPISLRLDLNNPDLSEDMTLPPSPLYHFTTAAGLTGIVKSESRLQATCHRFMNDSGEITFGTRIALDVLEARRDLSSKLKVMTRRMIEARMKEDSFIACLSTHYDILTQWRLYADNGAGYCIGFHDMDRMDFSGDENDLWFTHLLRCQYGRAEVEAVLTERFDRKIKRLEGLKPKDRDPLLASQLSEVAWRYAQVAKHQHFSSEDEWRYIVGAPKRDTKYQMSKRGLTPYLPTKRLTIKEVWIGPMVRSNKKVAIRELGRFLRSYGIKAKLDVWPSTFRG